MGRVVMIFRKYMFFLNLQRDICGKQIYILLLSVMQCVHQEYLDEAEHE